LWRAPSLPQRDQALNKQGFISFASGDEDQIMEVALDAGAQDVISNDDGSIDVITTPEDFFSDSRVILQLCHHLIRNIRIVIDFLRVV
jgi:transcriptional/translational regulatory protein YebC/TACO1